MTETLAPTLEQWFKAEDLKLIQESDIVLMAGLPGSGKSFVGRAIASFIGAEVLRSDDIRQVTFADSGRLEQDSSLYAPKSEVVYAYMRQRMVEIALNGGKVVVDATHMNNHRVVAIDALRSAHLLDSSVMVLVESDPEIVIARQRSRMGDPGTGETWEEGWLRVYNWFQEQLNLGHYCYPSEADGIRVLQVKNI
jgi:predicted kinase